MNNLFTSYILLSLFVISGLTSSSAQDFVASFEYKQAPPVEKTKKQSKNKRKKQRTAKFKEKYNNKFPKSILSIQKETVHKPGFLIMAIFGFILLAIGLTLLILSSGGSLLRVLLGLLFTIVSLIGLGLLVPGLIFSIIYNSKKYLNKHRKEIEATKNERKSCKRYQTYKWLAILFTILLAISILFIILFLHVIPVLSIGLSALLALPIILLILSTVGWIVALARMKTKERIARQLNN